VTRPSLTQISTGVAYVYSAAVNNRFTDKHATVNKQSVTANK